MTDTSIILSASATFFLTYVFHSTITLFVAWIRVSAASRDHHRMAERWWKVAAILPVITAALQTTLAGRAGSSIERTWTRDSQIVEARWVNRWEASSARTSTLMQPLADERRRSEATSTPKAADEQWQWTIDSNRQGDVSTPLPASIHYHPHAPSLLSRYLGRVRNPWLSATVARWIATIGLCVVAMGIVRFCLQSLRLRRRLARLPVLHGGRIRHLLDELMELAGVEHRVCLRQADEATLPFAHGLFRWTITVPRRIEKKLDRDQLKALLAHELAHLVRRDTGWLHAGRLLGTCFFFQPLNYLARSRWLRAAEFCCDDWAVRQAIDPVSLAHCLTSVAQHRMRPWSRVSLGMADDRSLLSNRVERLLRDTGSSASCHSVARRLMTLSVAILAGHLLIMVSPTVSVSSTSGIALTRVANAMQTEPEVELLTLSLAELDQEMLKLDDVLRSTPGLHDTQLNRQLAATYQQIRLRQSTILARRDQIVALIRSHSSQRERVRSSVSR